MNLGLEGVMLMGAVVAFVATVHTGNAAVGVLAGALAGGLFNLLFGVPRGEPARQSARQRPRADVLRGGAERAPGGPYVGSRIAGLHEIRIPVLYAMPLVGPMFFQL